MKLSTLLPSPLRYFDVGARGGLGKPWLDFDELLQVTGFEADAEECRRLGRDASTRHCFLPYAISDREGERKFYLLHKRACSSFYKPNFSLLSHFPGADQFKIEKEVSLSTTTFDHLAARGEISGVDFLKLDIQGAELDALKGGVQFLSANALGLELEVEFSPLYENQPLFAEVDAFIRTQLGLELFDLRHSHWKFSAGRNAGSQKGQLLFGDALYLRSPRTFFEWLKAMPPQKKAEKLAAAVACGHIYGFCDYSLALLAHPDAEAILGARHTDLVSFIEAQGKNLLPGFSKLPGRRHFANLFWYLYLRFQPMHRDWWYSTRGPGSQKRLGWFV